MVMVMAVAIAVAMAANEEAETKVVGKLGAEMMAVAE